MAGFVQVKLRDIPAKVDILEQEYLLVGAIEHCSAVPRNSHYQAAVKAPFRNKWELYSNHMDKLKLVSANQEIVVDALLYIKNI